MQTYTMVAGSEPAESREEELGAWFDETHLADAFEVRGFDAWRYYKLPRLPRSDVFHQKCVCIYECCAEDDEHGKAIIDRINVPNLHVATRLTLAGVNLRIYRTAGRSMTCDDV